MLALGLILGSAVATLLDPPAPLDDAAQFSVVDVTEGDVSRSVQLNASAAWNQGADLVNVAEGVLTGRLVRDGDQVDQGEFVYTVDLSPVATAVGGVPAFRDLVAGVTGADVTQLQRMLRSTGHRDGAPTGVFDATTEAEVRAWQRDAGQPATGRVPLGAVVFVPRLPAPVAWAGPVPTTDPDGSTPVDGRGVVGTRLMVGDVVARLLPPAPTFSIDLPAAQLRLVQTGMPVALELDEQRWEAEVGAVAPARQDGSAVATLRPARGAERICGADCGSVSVAGEGGVAATITVVAPVSGPLVPTAALVVAPDGSSAVVTEADETLAVAVLATSGGQAVVSGVDAGTRIRVPGVAGSEVGRSNR